jgi:transposase
MIPSGVQIFVALEPIDLRWSFDRLAGAALERTGYDARSGALFIYFGKRRDAVKVLVLFFDGSGMCQFYKRLDRRVFRLPEALSPGARHVEFDEALLDGADLAEAPKRARRARPRVRLH